MAILSSSHLGFEAFQRSPNVEVVRVEPGNFEFFGADDLYYQRYTFWLKMREMPEHEFWASFLLDDETACLVYDSERLDPKLNPEFFSETISTCVNHGLEI